MTANPQYFVSHIYVSNDQQNFQIDITWFTPKETDQALSKTHTNLRIIHTVMLFA